MRIMFPFDLETTHEAKKLILKLVKAKLALFENQNRKDIQNHAKEQDESINLELDDNVLYID